MKPKMLQIISFDMSGNYTGTSWTTKIKEAISKGSKGKTDIESSIIIEWTRETIGPIDKKIITASCSIKDAAAAGSMKPFEIKQGHQMNIEDYTTK
jgi:hypothetical protein